MFLLYLHAISVSSGKGSGDASHCLHMEFSMKVGVWRLGLGWRWGGGVREDGYWGWGSVYV